MKRPPRPLTANARHRLALAPFPTVTVYGGKGWGGAAIADDCDPHQLHRRRDRMGRVLPVLSSSGDRVTRD
jgi:hypothetical protein